MYKNATTCLTAPVLRHRTTRGKNRLASHAGPQAKDGIRHGLVARIRAEIAAGTYDTEEKLEAAMERLLSDLDG